ncbi:MAG: hypothetical protein PHS93_08355 [Candidatus Omnitrophica bacterium]|nr:hypothetical protein [Candidatus Omnitrophota bacterium]
MTPEYKAKLIKAYDEFGRLKSFCEAKGQIEIMPQLQGIRVLKKTPEVKKLKEIIDFLKPANFKWLDK